MIYSLLILELSFTTYLSKTKSLPTNIYDKKINNCLIFLKNDLKSMTKTLQLTYKKLTKDAPKMKGHSKDEYFKQKFSKNYGYH